MKCSTDMTYSTSTADGAIMKYNSKIFKPIKKSYKLSTELHAL